MNFTNIGILVMFDSVEHEELSLKNRIGGKTKLNASPNPTTKRFCLDESDPECNNKGPQQRNSRHFGSAASSVSKLIESKEGGFSKGDIKKSCRTLQNHICFIENQPKKKYQYVMSIGDSTTAHGADFTDNLDIHSKTNFKSKQKMNILSCTAKMIGPMYSKCNTKHTQQKITGYMIKDSLNRNNSCVDVFGKGDSSTSTSSLSLLTKNQFSNLGRTGEKKSWKNQLMEPINHPSCIDTKNDNREIQGKSVPVFMHSENYKNNSDVNSSPISLSSMLNLNKEVSTKTCKVEPERNHVLESTNKAFFSDSKNSKCNVMENRKYDRPEVLNRDGNCQHVSHLRSEVLSFLSVSDRKKDSDIKRLLVASKQSIALSQKVIWKNITGENLFLQYGRLFPFKTADYIFQRLEEEVEYFTGDLLRVKVYGKWHDIPRKQASYGDSGLSYSFSGNCIPAIPWNKSEIIMQLKHVVEKVCHHHFNFVLVNRYKDGLDHMGEHRDDEKDLVFNAPIASLSFGQARDFIFKHKDSRGKQCLRKIDPVKLELENGSILVMQHPTNTFWYHSLPVRKNAYNARVNLTFRDMVIK